MRTFDLTPLYRSTVGFDRLFSLLDNYGGDGSAPSSRPCGGRRSPLQLRRHPGLGLRSSDRLLAADRFGYLEDVSERDADSAP